jgi:hypothetical protein
MRRPRSLSKRLRARRRRLVALCHERKAPFTQDALTSYWVKRLDLANAIDAILRRGQFRGGKFEGGR